MKVLVSDPLSERGIEILKKAGLSVDVKMKLSPDLLLAEIGHYDGLIIRSATKVTKEVIAAAANLKVIGRAGSGLDNVDIPAATKRGIVVMNTPGGNTVTTAEHTFALIFAIARQIPQATASVKSGKWEKNKFMGLELFNKTIGIIGFGQIGAYVAKLAQGVNMNVLAYDLYLSPEQAQKSGVEQVTLDEILARSDVITIHTPLTAETKHMIDARAIGKMKNGVRIVNAARGGIVNEKDLYKAMLSGKVAAAGFDVFEQEPVDPKNPLVSLENFICTPHLGAATTEAQENVAWAIAEQLVDYLVHGVIRHAVNIPAVPADLLPKIRPYITLAERLGAFLGQICEGGVKRLSVEYRGEAADLNLASATVAAVKGLLSPMLEETVNYVNAPAIAKERGIEIMETRSSDAGNFSTLLRLTVEAGGRTVTAAGSIFNRVEPRVVEVDGMALEVIPEGPMLFIANNDKPGVIGGIGNVLAEAGINISRMQLGRETPGGHAISVVGIDVAASAEMLSRLRKIPNILSVRQIRL